MKGIINGSSSKENNLKPYLYVPNKIDNQYYSLKAK